MSHSVGYFLTLIQCGLKMIVWTSHIVKFWKSRSYSTRQPATHDVHCQTHQIHISRANKLLLPTFKWIISTKGFMTIPPTLPWLFLRLKITLTYCFFDVLWVCTVFWFQPSSRLKFCFKHLSLVPTVEGRCPAQRTEDGGPFTNVASFFLSFFFFKT